MANHNSGDDRRSILTYNPEEEIWYYLSKLTHFEYVIQQLIKRIANRFFQSDTDKILKNKARRNEKLPNAPFSVNIAKM